MLLLPGSFLLERVLAATPVDGYDVTSSRSTAMASAISEDAIVQAQRAAHAAGKLRSPLPALDVVASAQQVATAMIRLDEVVVDVPAESSVHQIAALYAMSPEELIALNPGLDKGPRRAVSKVQIWRHDPATPASSRGRPSGGRLVNGAPMPNGLWWRVREPAMSWGTPYMIRHLAAGFEAVAARFNGAPVVVIGDLSARRGGRLRPHRSHQSGRDVDFAYYRLDGNSAERFVVTRPHELDVERQWYLLRFWIKSGVVDRMFIDPRLSRAMAEHAAASGDNPAFLDMVFGEDRAGRSGLIGYSPGHNDHAHVRFRCTKSDTSCRDV